MNLINNNDDSEYNNYNNVDNKLFQYNNHLLPTFIKSCDNISMGNNPCCSN